MVKRHVAGFQVPLVASARELREFVHLVYYKLNENCAVTAQQMGVTPATIWKLEHGEQMDSQILRNSLGIRRTPPRPRVWMPTNNIEAAVGKLYEHYTRGEIINAFMEAAIKEDPSGYLDVVWHGTGEENGFPGLNLDD